MAAFDFKVLLLWFDNSVQILQWVAVVLVVARASMRVKWLKKAIRGAQTHWYAGLIASVFFGFLAVLGNHSRMIWETNPNGHLEIMQFLSSKHWPQQPSVSLRDLMVLVAGLSAGPWVGFGSGLIAGSERFLVGGLVGSASGLTTLLLGVLGGLVMRFCPRCTLSRSGVSAVAITATLIKLLIVYYFVTPVEYAHDLVWATIFPATTVNAIGCLLFLSVIQDLKRERLEQLLQLARLRTLKAQIEPHFLNNRLNELNRLIRTDPDEARDYIILLADFCNDTRAFSEYNTVSLHQELTQLQRYLDLRRLDLGDKLQTTFAIPEDLFPIQVLPGCLLTFAENALKHAFNNCKPPYKLDIRAAAQGKNLILSVSDNGSGITPEQRLVLGNAPMQTRNKKGGGVALYQLTQCLNLILGDNARIDFKSSDNGGTVAMIIQPKWSTHYGN
ncbi:MAG: LytS/YhcK type 5TM receptor domain-containing protein [Methylococcales bacterium]